MAGVLWPPIPHPPSPTPDLPAVDDHLVPEAARWELLQGERIVTPPSGEPHATQHLDLGYVLRAHVAEGWRVATDLLTRVSNDDDFAPDLSIYPAARDPHTGGRQLEALAFEIVSHQAMTVPTRKAIALIQRGVRRVFALKLRKRAHTLLEFDPQHASWRILTPSSSITDPVLALPIPVDDLLKAANADGAVARALLAKKLPELMAPIEAQRLRAQAAEDARDAQQQRADDERRRADDERQRADDERQRADDERQRADDERQRADDAENKLEAEQRRAERAETEREAIAKELASLKARAASDD